MIYLDYAATTPIDPRVLKAMRPYLTTEFGNPSSLHQSGQKALGAVDHAREIFATALNVDFREIFFTGSATEANNLVLRGIVKYVKSAQHAENVERPGRFNKQRDFADLTSFRPKVIISAIEHESVLRTARDLEKEGVEVEIVPVDKEGRINLSAIERSLDERTILVSIMRANNEIGTIQPVSEISKIITEYRFAKNVKNNVRRAEQVGRRGDRTDSTFSYPLFHTDAVQAFQFLPCHPRELGVDLMTFSAHKIYGPKGLGALYVREGARPAVLPLNTGGGQEFGLRSGTENVAGLVGFAKAVELIEQTRQKEYEIASKLQAAFWKGLQMTSSKFKLNGSRLGSSRLPNNLNIFTPASLSEETLFYLDRKGIAASSGSACVTRGQEASYVIQALGHDLRRAQRSLRFSWGRGSSTEDIRKTLSVLEIFFKNI